MVGYVRLCRFVGCVGAVVLLSAAQPPGSTPPAPPTTPTVPSTEPQPVPLPAPAPDRGSTQSLPPIGSAGQPTLPPGSSDVPPPQPGQPPRQTSRFNFKIDPKATAKDLLPAAPKVAPIKGSVLTNDLAKIPEVDFQAPLAGKDKLDPVYAAAHQIAKINHANAKKTDAFMAALFENRPELAGMPFVMGDDCRTHGERLKQFTQAANLVRQALGAGRLAPQPAPPTVPAPAPANFNPRELGSGGQAGGVIFTSFRTAQNAEVLQEIDFLLQPFWKQFTSLCEQQDTGVRRDKETVEHVTLARIAALTQILAPESAEIRLGLVKYLTGVPHVDATKALARMAIFSAEDDIRAAAVTALKVRREKDYTDVLVKGLRYPWPAVAKRAAEAITRLERTDLIPELVAMLDSTDPRMPETKEVDGKKVAIVREMVKMNHHRNCLMCHAPSGSGVPNPNAIQAEVAIQDQPLPLPFEGYRQSTPEIMIRLDVTYLRQDFSAALPVKDAHPWPEAQRFDFFVRERKLTEEEATSYRQQLATKEAGVLSPYHKAAVTALRDLTGKDAAPTAAAWRKLLTPDVPQ